VLGEPRGKAFGQLQKQLSKERNKYLKRSKITIAGKNLRVRKKTVFCTKTRGITKQKMKNKKEQTHVLRIMNNFNSIYCPRNISVTCG
jgi:hypothetical protein